ncbi:MAG: hypothetical protein FJ070_09860 [Cyanobacteria bacterium K_DeepCast_150m_m2_101]|nr:hypothetical protein [Cyanobacteria bacterium K_DeepCast_150m_m2_101]
MAGACSGRQHQGPIPLGWIEATAEGTADLLQSGLRGGADAVALAQLIQVDALAGLQIPPLQRLQGVADQGAADEAIAAVAGNGRGLRLGLGFGLGLGRFRPCLGGWRRWLGLGFGLPRGGGFGARLARRLGCLRHCRRRLLIAGGSSRCCRRLALGLGCRRHQPATCR